MPCACSQVPGKIIQQSPRERFPVPLYPARHGYIAGFSAVPPSWVVTGASTGQPLAPQVLVPSAVKPAPIVLTVAQARSLLATKNPTPAQAVAIIKQLIPPVSNFKGNVPVPKVSGNRASSNLSGLYGAQRAMAFGNLGSLGVGPVSEAAAGASAGAALGTVVPGIGNVIGGAIGAIVGLVAGLFGHKAALPHVTPADVAQAQSWMQQYTSVAGSVIGRGFTQTAIQDMLTAEAILDPNFWGRGTSTNLVIPAITNFYNEVMTRLMDFFQALQAAPVGSTITLHDDPSIPGHGKTNIAVTYSFANPGVNAPSYVLGPIFAQYFYMMCTIFQPPSNCTGHLTAPIPQMYTDVLDWFRSARPQWDTPQPNVVTGTDLSIAAPSVPGVPPAPQGISVPTPGVQSMMPTGQSAPGIPSVSYAPGGMPVPLAPNQTGIFSPPAGGPYSATPPGLVPPGGAYSNLPGSTVGGGGLDMSQLSSPGPLGFSWLTWGLIGAGALLVLRK